MDVRGAAGSDLVVSAEHALFQTFWVVLLVTAAALTRSLAGFALLCSGAIAALVALVMVLIAIVTASTGETPLMAGGAENEDSTGAVVGTLLAVAAGLALLVPQYATRSRVRSVATGAGGLLLAFMVASAWPWPLLAPRLDVPAWTADESSLRLGARAESVRVEEETAWPGRRSPWRVVRAHVWISGIEAGWSASIGVLDAALQIDRDTTLTSAVSNYPSPVPVEQSDEHPRHQAVRQLLGVQRLVASGPPGVEKGVYRLGTHVSQYRLVWPAECRLPGAPPGERCYVSRHR